MVDAGEVLVHALLLEFRSCHTDPPVSTDSIHLVSRRELVIASRTCGFEQAHLGGRLQSVQQVLEANVRQLVHTSIYEVRLMSLMVLRVL